MEKVLQLNPKLLTNSNESFIAEVQDVQSGIATEVSYLKETITVDHCLHGNRKLSIGDQVIVQQISGLTLVTHRLPKKDEPTEPLLSYDGEQWTLQSESTVQLKVGKATLELSSNGDVAIAGEDLLSEANGLNRILGMRIELN